MNADRGRADDKLPRLSVSRQEIRCDFETLIAQRRLSGAARDPAIIDGGEFNPKVLRKKGKRTRFLIRNVPSRRRLLRLWARHFENASSR